MPTTYTFTDASGNNTVSYSGQTARLDMLGEMTSYLKTAKNIEKKLTSYLHHREYDLERIGEKGIQKMITNKKPVYNLNVDSKKNKFDGGEELQVASTDELPNYIKSNLDKYKDWLE